MKDYTRFGSFSFFGPDKMIFNDVEVSGEIITWYGQGFAGFVFATKSSSDLYNFTNCVSSV